MLDQLVDSECSRTEVVASLGERGRLEESWAATVWPRFLLIIRSSSLKFLRWLNE